MDKILEAIAGLPDKAGKIIQNILKSFMIYSVIKINLIFIYIFKDTSVYQSDIKF